MTTYEGRLSEYTHELALALTQEHSRDCAVRSEKARLALEAAPTSKAKQERYLHAFYARERAKRAVREIESMRKPDLTVINLGTMWRIETGTPAGRIWVEENVHVEGLFGDASTFIGDHRPMREIVLGAQADGLLVAGA
jgi:hypothetical protein